MRTRHLLGLATGRMGVDENEACRELYHLIANHRVGLDLDAEFAYDSELWLLPETNHSFKPVAGRSVHKVENRPPLLDLSRDCTDIRP